MGDKILHLVVRFSDDLFGIGDVITKHNDVVARSGYVWFGKIGVALSANRIELLNQQIAEGTTTFAYLVKGNRKIPTAYRASLLSLTKELPKSESKYFPQYYSDKGLLQFMKVWLKMGEIYPIELSTLNNLKTISSINLILETLARSSSGYFFVYESKTTF
jgi:hypothetical protein